MIFPGRVVYFKQHSWFDSIPREIQTVLCVDDFMSLNRILKNSVFLLFWYYFAHYNLDNYLQK